MHELKEFLRYSGIILIIAGVIFGVIWGTWTVLDALIPPSEYKVCTITLTTGEVESQFCPAGWDNGTSGFWDAGTNTYKKF